MTLSKTKTTIVIVPLRLASSRLTEKILAPIGRLSLSQRVLTNALKIDPKNCLVVAAVDSEKTRFHLEQHFGNKIHIVMTNPKLRSGSDRVRAAYKKLCQKKIINSKYIKTIVNIQGDTPFFDPQAVKVLLDKRTTIKDKNAMWTLVQKWPAYLDPMQPSHVKALVTKKNRAIYFSRWPIPCTMPVNTSDLLFHIGVYAYTPAALELFCSSKSPAMELSEKLEQLRALEIGIPFYVFKVTPKKSFTFRGIDTKDDLLWAQNSTYAMKG